jgi:hypothetical protein
LGDGVATSRLRSRSLYATEERPAREPDTSEMIRVPPGRTAMQTSSSQQGRQAPSRWQASADSAVGGFECLVRHVDHVLPVPEPQHDVALWGAAHLEAHTGVADCVGQHRLLALVGRVAQFSVERPLPNDQGVVLPVAVGEFFGRLVLHRRLEDHLPRPGLDARQ